MRRSLSAGAAAAALLVSGCSSIIGNGTLQDGSGQAGSKVPQTIAAAASNYGYIPLDPIGVAEEACPAGTKPVPLLEALPDQAVRLATAEVSANGGLTFGPSKVTVQDRSYRAIMDYINADSVPVVFHIRALWTQPEGDQYQIAYPSQTVPLGQSLAGYEAVILAPGETLPEGGGWERVTIPVYVGVGLRLYADIHALEGGIVLSGLGVIGAQAEAKALAGTLTVQSMGITSKSITVALPLPNKLDQTTIENAILAIGSVRSLMYGTSEQGDVITRTPRIVGLYSPLGSDPRLINAVYSELARVRPPWKRPCT